MRLGLAAGLIVLSAPLWLPSSAAHAEEATEIPQVEAEDRRGLARLAAQLPAHGVPAVRVPEPDAEDAKWLRLAKRLIRVWAPPRQRSRDARAELMARRPLTPVIEALVPRHRRYTALMRKYATLKEALVKGQPTIARPPYEVRVGTTAPEVEVLRERLLLEGYGDREVKGRLKRYFDHDLKRALWAWQKDHGHPVTVVLDDFTRAKLNAPVSPILGEVALAMKRWRQLSLRADEGPQVLVHLNRMRLVAERDGATELDMKVVIGRADEVNETPALSTQLVKVIAHPTWSVPRRIIEETLRPSVADVPDLLRDRGYSVEVLPSGNWRVVHPPGPANPLGHLKFSLQGTGGIYLHATPNHDAFKATKRMLSHGCVRLEAPEALARWVIPEEEHAALEDALRIDEGERARPWLHRVEAPPSVHLVYQTLEAAEDGTLIRHPDVYGRDKAELAKIDVDKLMAAPAPVLPSDEQAPYTLDVTVVSADGSQLSLKRHAGRILVATFVAGWCVRCTDLAGPLARVVDAANARGGKVDLVGIAFEEGGAEAASAYIDKAKPPYDVVAGGEMILAGETPFGMVERLPTTWIIGRTGVPLYRYEGADIAPALAEDLARYLSAEAKLPD